MSDTLKTCEYCGKEFVAKRSTARFDTPACKLKFNRKQSIDTELEKNELSPTVQASRIDPVIGDVPAEILEAFSEPDDTGRPEPGSEDWYVYGTQDDPNKAWDKVCVRCGGKFTTSLSMRKFCSELCLSEIMIVIAEGPHKNYKG